MSGQHVAEMLTTFPTKVEQTHSKSYCGMGVKLHLHELYPNLLTRDKQSTSKHGQTKTKSNATHSQLTPHLINLLSHILEQNYIARSAHSQTSTPISLIKNMNIKAVMAH